MYNYTKYSEHRKTSGIAFTSAYMPKTESRARELPHSGRGRVETSCKVLISYKTINWILGCPLCALEEPGQTI